MFMGGASRNDAAMHFNVHRTIVKRQVNNLEEIRSTRNRPSTGRPRVTKPNQDRKIRRTHTGNRFESFVQTAGTFHGWHYP